MSLSYFDQQLFEVVVTKNFPKEKLEFSKGDILMILNEMSNTDKYYSKDTHETKIARHKVFKYFVRYCLYRNLANFDSLVLLTGEKGVGKSSFAMMLCREWCKAKCRGIKHYVIPHTNICTLTNECNAAIK